MSFEKLGLKCGIEIHQQLEGKKLFCSCPTLMRDDEPHFQILRSLRASAGESGEIDIAAKQEQQKQKQFLYQGYHDTTCLVETDSEPPHPLNQDALYTVLQFSKLVQSDIISVIQVMRKTVIDGSNTSGFQRTALVAQNGIIHTSQGDIHITGINIEEDACKIIEEKKDTKIYRLDRLGIPLIEIGTSPDIKSPEQCLETAKKIGLLLRSLPGVKRGLGTIRQDINVSIIGGTRVEIKGAKELRLLTLYVELEAKRQQELLKLRENLNDSKIKLNPLEIIDLTGLFLKSNAKIIQKTIEKNGKILAIRVDWFSGFIGRELVPNYRVGTELSGRAKIKAGVGGIFHSDELPNYGITAEEVGVIKRKLNCNDKDAFILVADEEKKSTCALNAVYERLQELWLGVPKEVRKANPDGTTSYMRPMPGAARMYPETDIPLVKPDLKHITIPETLEEKSLRYQQQFQLSKDLAEFVAKSDQMPLFEELLTKYPLQKYPTMKPAFIAETLTSTPTELKRKYNADPDLLTEQNFRDLFLYLSQDKIHKDIVLDVLLDMTKNTFNIQKYAKLSTEELHQGIKEIITQNPNAPFSALMGLCIKKFQGKASGQFISEELKRIQEKGHK